MNLEEKARCFLARHGTEKLLPNLVQQAERFSSAVEYYIGPDERIRPICYAAMTREFLQLRPFQDKIPDRTENEYRALIREHYGWVQKQI